MSAIFKNPASLICRDSSLAVEVSLKRTIWATVTVGLAALMTFGCGNVFDSSNGSNDGNNTVPFIPGQTVGNPSKVWAVDTAGQIFFFLSDNPGIVSVKSNITGLPGAERIIAIDCRPRTGLLYGITNLGKLFWIDKTTFAATQVPGGVAPASANADIDFNPQVDRIRQESGVQNVAIHPGTGAVTAQTNLTIQPGGTPANSVACAYTNPEEAPTSTQLFVIDGTTKRVYLQATPADGQLTEVGQLPADIGPNVGFDIAPGNIGFAAVQRASDAFSVLLRLDPTSGAAALVDGPIGGGVPVKSIAVDLNGPAVTKFVGIDSAKNLIRFNSNNPGNVLSSNVITGVPENIIGCDFSPGGNQATGLKVLTVPAVAPFVGRIYSVDLTPGATFAVGTLVSTTTVNLPDPTGKQFGVDIIPGAAGGTMIITAATGTFSGRRAVSGQSTDVFSTVVATGATTPLPSVAGSYIPALGFNKNFLGSGAASGLGINLSQTGAAGSEVPFMEFVGLTAAGFQTAISNVGQVTTEVSELDVEPSGNIWFVGPRVNVAFGVNATDPFPVDGFSTLYQVTRPALAGVPVGNVGSQTIKNFAIIPTLNQSTPGLTEAP